MTLLKGITPSPAQVAQAYRDAFGSAISEAGGKDGRISRSAAERLAERDDAGKLVADNIVHFLDATGQKTVSAQKMTDVVAEYARRESEAAAGPNQRLSLLEIRNLPVDLQADVRHLRGKDDLAPTAPRTVMDEDHLYELLQAWKPTETVAEGQLRHDGTKLVQSGLTPVRADWQPVVEAAMQNAWDRVLQHRVWNDEPLQIAPNQQGTLRLGPMIDEETGKLGVLAYWRDIDDGSFAWFFTKDDSGTYQEAAEVFLN